MRAPFCHLAPPTLRSRRWLARWRRGARLLGGAPFCLRLFRVPLSLRYRCAAAAFCSWLETTSRRGGTAGTAPAWRYRLRERLQTRLPRCLLPSTPPLWCGGTRHIRDARTLWRRSRVPPLRWNGDSSAKPCLRADERLATSLARTAPASSCWTFVLVRAVLVPSFANISLAWKTSCCSGDGRFICVAWLLSPRGGVAIDSYAVPATSATCYRRHLWPFLHRHPATAPHAAPSLPAPFYARLPFLLRAYCLYLSDLQLCAWKVGL